MQNRLNRSIKMPFGLETRVGPGNNVLGGSPDPPREGAIFGKKGRPTVKYRDTITVICAKTAEPIEMPFVSSDGSKESCVRWGLEVLRDVAMATIFWLSIYGCTWAPAGVYD